MKCIVVNRIGEFEIADRDIPKPGPGELLLKVTVTGLCRTDLKIIRVGHRDLVLPRILGNPVLFLYTIIQHVDMEEDQLDLRRSTRSFSTNGFSRFLYMNMNFHVEHHMYPTVPFHALSALNDAVKDQLPEPDPGFFLTNFRVLKAIIARSLGKLPMANQGKSITTG